VPPFLRKLLLAVVAFVAVLALGFWLGSRGEAPPRADAQPPARVTAPEAAPPRSGGSARTVPVARIVDGDTLDLADGRRIRLVQIDTPELRGSECYAEEASAHLSNLVPPGTAVRIEIDPNLDEVDRYGRQLGYVFKASENVNVTLVREGAASVWFYGGRRGKYAADLEAAAGEAHAQGRGLWRACPGTVYDPSRAVATTTATAASPPASAAPVATPAAQAADAGNCDANYQGACVPPYDEVGDLDCADIASAVDVVGSDPHGFDGNDNDGLGCESYG
jgi:micrococcal nuclease